MRSEKMIPFADVMMDQYPYGYVTVHEESVDGDVICEGIVRSMSRILDFRSIRIRAFYVTELEDGSVQIDIGV